ncbi:unnamed protein product [Cunninghamella echinulata]
MKRGAEIDSDKKKRRLTTSTTAKNARYPLSFLFSSIEHCQSPQCLCNSVNGIIAATSAHPNSNPLSIYCISGDMYSVKNVQNYTSTASPIIKRTPLQLAEKYHKQHTISHFQWNQNGSTLLSADETGKIALWNLENSLEIWSLTYQVDIHQPIATVLWLNADRTYKTRKDTNFSIFNREKVVGPRNPYGYLAFVVVTVYGEISVHYQRNGSIFSSFSTNLPKIGHYHTIQEDAGCYSMSLEGLDNWLKISHVSIALDEEGDIYLATYYSESLPKTVYTYKISIKFPGKNDVSGAILCESLSDTKLISSPELSLDPIIDPETVVTQIILSCTSKGIILRIGFGKKLESENQFTGYFGKWILQKKSQQISDSINGNAFGDNIIQVDRMEFQYDSGFVLDNRFITSFCQTKSGQLALGLSDGSIHMEFQEKNDFGLLKCYEDDQSTSLNSNFWEVSAAHKHNNNFTDPVVGITLSSNETHIVYMLSPGRIGLARITIDNITDTNDHNIGTLTILERYIQLSLLNQIDNLDLISELIRIMHQNKCDDKIINNTLLAYESFSYQEDINNLRVLSNLESIINNSDYSYEEWDLVKNGPAYGFVIGVYRRLPEKRVPFINLIKAIQLPIIYECFIGSCTSDISDITAVLDSPDENKINLTFNPDSLWSLVPLASWTFEYVRWILKEWNLLFNSKYPKGSKYENLSSRHVHAVLLIHKESRTLLIKILVFIQHFIQFSTTSNYELVNIPQSKPLLLKQINTRLTSEPVLTNDVISFLQALGNIKDLDNVLREHGTKSRWSILVSSMLPSGSILDQLKTITNEYKSKCASTAIYLENHKEYPIDVIKKRPVTKMDHHIRSCIRCHQLYISEPTDIIDPMSFSSWYQSLTRRCICGGLFF